MSNNDAVLGAPSALDIEVEGVELDLELEVETDNGGCFWENFERGGKDVLIAALVAKRDIYLSVMLRKEIPNQTRLFFLSDRQYLKFELTCGLEILLKFPGKGKAELECTNTCSILRPHVPNNSLSKFFAQT